MPRLLLPGLSVFFFLPDPASAQTSITPQVRVQLSDSVYQGGRKRSSRGIRLTTSSVSLTDLNAILTSTPQPQTAQPVKKQPVAKKQTSQAPRAAQSIPRFGYGSGPVAPPAPADPRIPVDPGYQPIPPMNQPLPVPQSSTPVGQPSVQIQHTTTIPFAHGYYPRTYVPSIPFLYPYGNQFHFGYPGCGLFPSRAPLRGSLTSSRNYLSGFRSFRFRF